jgi:hypothetical protein
MALVQKTSLRLSADLLDRLRRLARRRSFVNNTDANWAQVARTLLEGAVATEEQRDAEGVSK